MAENFKRGFNIDRIGILYIINNLEIGGTERQLIQLVNHLDKNQFEPWVCCFQNKTSALVSLADCEFVSINFRGLYHLQIINTIKDILRFCREKRISLVQSFFFTESVINVIMAKRDRKLKSIISKRNLAPGGYSLWQSWVINRLWRHVDAFIANSEAVKQRVVELEGISPEKCKVIYNGIDLTQYIQPTEEERMAAKKGVGVPEESFVVGMTANLNPVKDPWCLMKAALKILKVYPYIRFILVGDGPLRSELEKYCKGKGILDKILFVGSVVDAIPFLKAFDIGVLTSISEGFSNSILEYMAMGLPVIATNVGGNKESILDGRTGFLIPPGDYGVLADRITKLMHDTVLRRNYSREARIRVEELFHLDKMVENYQRFYMSLFNS